MRFTAGALFTIAFLLYAVTGVPDLPLVDSGELATAVHRFGVAHPPGFPLYSLVGGLVSNLPGCSPVRALNLMSGFFAALSVVACWLGARAMVGIVAGGDHRSHAGWIALFPAAAWMTDRVGWYWSGLTEVYTFGAFLYVSALAFFFTWVERRRSKRTVQFTPLAGLDRLLTAAIVFGTLGLANHHATAVIVLITLGAGLFFVAPGIVRVRSFWATVASALFISVAFYLWLIPAAAHDTALGWGGIDSLDSMVDHVVGKQYKSQIGGDLGDSSHVASIYCRSLLFDLGVVPTLAALAGVIGLFVSRWGKSAAGVVVRRASILVFALPILLAILNAGLSSFYIITGEDRSSYDIPGHIAWALLGAPAFFLLVRGRIPAGRSVKTVAVIAVLVTVIPNVVRNLPYCDRRDDRSARVFVEESLGSLPAGSLVFLRNWNLHSSYVYLRYVEDFRPDLQVVNAKMMRRDWYMNHLDRAIPELLERSQKEYTRFLKQVIPFNRGGSYSNEEIAAAYGALMRRWVEVAHEQGRRVYADYPCLQEQQEWDWLRAFPSSADDLLIRLHPVGGPPPAMTALTPKNAANLSALRGRAIGSGPLVVNPEIRFHSEERYWQVYSAYLDAVRSNLVAAAATGGGVALESLAREYGSWFPDAAEVASRIAGEGIQPGR